MRSLESWVQYVEKHYGSNRGGDLALIKKTAQDLGILEFNCPVITIGGTNGKGSCAAFLESMLLTEGYRIATYTSPHLLRFTERVRLNGREVGAALMCEALQVIDAECKNFSFSYFAIITLAALYIFKQQKLDALILEVGLGGRFDPVNIVDADVSVISTISLDHTDRLGTTREAIGFEKAGIMRQEKPVVCGDSSPPDTLVKQANSLSACFYCLGEQFKLEEYGDCWSWFCGNDILENLPLPQLPLPSAASVLMVLRLLKGRLSVSTNTIYKCIEKTSLPARMQLISESPEIVLDVAHNEEAAQYLAARLSARTTSGRTFAVIGMLADKDIKAVCEKMIKVVDSWYCGDLSIERGSKAGFLAKCIKNLGAELCYTHDSVLSALWHAIDDCQNEDRIVVFGSFYTAAEILRYCLEGRKWIHR